MPVVLGQHPLGQLLKKPLPAITDALGLAVVAAGNEDVALGEVAAGEETTVTGSVGLSSMKTRPQAPARGRKCGRPRRFRSVPRR